MGGAAALRAGASQRDFQLGARSPGMERICFWPWPDASGHDAVRGRRYPPDAERGSAFSVPVLNMDVTELARQITMKTAECEGVHDPGAFPGASVSDVAKAESNEVDSIIEIDNKSLTNRPDLWGHLGMAREVAAIAGLSVADPVGEVPAAAKSGDLSITIQDPSLCARFSGQRVENVKVAPSPLWMQVRLNSLGVNPINNLEDVTNYVLYELGQPMHAYDAELLGSTIVVRAAKKGEQILALNGE